MNRHPLPFIAERRYVFSFLDRELAKLERLAGLQPGNVGDDLGKLGTLLRMLDEYKCALVSAAVTGKIDARGEVE